MNAWKYWTLLFLMAGIAVACSSPAPAPAADPAAAPTAGPTANPPAAAVSEAPKPAADKTASTPAPAPAPVPAPKPIEVPAGTELRVVLADSLASDSNKAGDEFVANLAEPLKVNGTTVLTKGAKFRGRVVEATAAGKVKGLASIRLVLTGITRDAKVIPIVTSTYIEEAEATKGRDAGIVGGAAGVGAAIGAIAGGKKGAGIGAIVGGAAGTGGVLATRGKEVSLAPEAKLTFKLEKAVGIVP